MGSYSLNIADYIIKIEPAQLCPELKPSARFNNFICNDYIPDITITVRAEKHNPAEPLKRVFNAPLAENVTENGGNGGEFWSVYTGSENLFLKITYPDGMPVRESWLRFSLSGKKWDLFIDTEMEIVDPLDYPLDGLILYYLTYINCDIFIHASGVNYNGRGFIFTGPSGKGKSTIAGIWDKGGGFVIHDDRLIIRNKQSIPVMYNTPVYDNQLRSESSVESVFVISHGIENKMVEIKQSKALSLILSNCIQHNWDQDIIRRLTGALYDLNGRITTYTLSFRPDNSIIDYILGNG